MPDNVDFTWVVVIGQFIVDHWDEVLEIIAVVCTAITLIVRVTPSKTDDVWWENLMVRFSFLRPKNDPRGAVKLPFLHRNNPINNAVSKTVKGDE